MPDWKPELRRRLATLKLEPAREATIIEELAQHLEDSYAELIGGIPLRRPNQPGEVAELVSSSPKAHVLFDQGHLNLCAPRAHISLSKSVQAIFGSHVDLPVD